MSKRRVENAVILGAGAGIFTLGVAVGQLVLYGNQPSEEEVAAVRSERDTARADFDALTEEGSCADHVLETILVTGFSSGTGDPERTITTTLETVCGEPADQAVVAESVEAMRAISAHDKKLSELEDRTTTSLEQHALAGAIGGTILFGAAWGVYTSAVRG